MGGSKFFHWPNVHDWSDPMLFMYNPLLEHWELRRHAVPLVEEGPPPISHPPFVAGLSGSFKNISASCAVTVQLPRLAIL